MTTKMEKIYQHGLFSKMKSIGVYVPEESKYRILAECLPWAELAEIANRYRSKHVDIHFGAPLNLRLHLGAYIVQTMDGLTDRKTEETVRYHAGVRLLCGVEGSTETIDHTSIEDFRNKIGPEGAEELNKIIVQYAVKEGFTGSRLCSSDTTVQEAPISHPTEVSHLRKISGKLTGIGRRIRKGVASKVEKLKEKVEEIVTEIRLFTRGKNAVGRKKKLGKKLRRTVSKMHRMVEEAVGKMGAAAREQYKEDLELYRKMLHQIREWMRTGRHPKGKIISLWYEDARAISRGKVSKAVEFGRRWFITLLTGGYIIGKPCQKLGSDTDGKIAGEILPQFGDIFGMMPKMFVYDRGGDEKTNHKVLKDAKVERDCIFRKGKGKMGVGRNTLIAARRERALSEAAIATIKCRKYDFNRPGAKSGEACITKGQMAMIGANINRLIRDLKGGLPISEAV